MKIAGFILIAIGLIDLIGSYAGFDLWGGFLGINLPDAIWQITAYIEFGIGYLLIKLGTRDEPEAEAEA